MVPAARRLHGRGRDLGAVGLPQGDGALEGDRVESHRVGVERQLHSERLACRRRRHQRRDDGHGTRRVALGEFLGNESGNHKDDDQREHHAHTNEDSDVGLPSDSFLLPGVSGTARERRSDPGGRRGELERDSG